MSSVVHDLEQKRVICLKAQERKKKEDESKSFLYKSAEQLDKEKRELRWKTSKVKKAKHLKEIHINVPVHRCGMICVWSRKLTSSLGVSIGKDMELMFLFLTNSKYED